MKPRLKGQLAFGAMLALALVVGLLPDGDIAGDAPLRDLACAETVRAIEAGEPTETSSAAALRTLCAEARSGDVYGWPDQVQTLPEPIDYIEYSGFVERPKRITAVEMTGTLKGIVCADNKYRWGQAESRMPGGEWDPDVRRRRCVEAFADDVMRYEAFAGPDADGYYLVAVDHRGALYVGWTHMRALDLHEAYIREGKPAS